ncbi:electron transport complex subunit RsxG [Spongorhabdus nitratireducens]
MEPRPETETNTSAKGLMLRAASASSLTLGLFAALTVGLITLTWVFTKARIDDQIRQAEIRALEEILPRADIDGSALYDNDLLKTRISIPVNKQLGSRTTAEGYAAFKGDTPVAVILPVVAPKGYSGAIHMLVGIKADGTLSGVRVTNHKETPGLGDAIEIIKSNWITVFSGKSLDNPQQKGWGVRKDGGEFDQFTGATITPRAVVLAVHNSLQYFEQNRDQLFQQGLKQLKQTRGDAHGQPDA